MSTAAENEHFLYTLTYFSIGVIITTTNRIVINTQVRSVVNSVVLICVLTKHSTHYSV